MEFAMSRIYEWSSMDAAGDEFEGTANRPTYRLVQADNLRWMQRQDARGYELIYLDPPFNTGKRQAMKRVRNVRDESGDHVGFGGRRYRSEVLSTQSYADAFDDYLGFLTPRLEECARLLTEQGSLFVHVDPRESHYVKVTLDEIFGRDCFRNEIVWAYDYGGRSRRSWPAKHDVILWYSRDPKQWTYRYDDIERVPYMAPGLVGPKKAARGKVPTDVWWQTIVAPQSRERTGYPTQKPAKILDRIVRVHSNPGERVLDPFAGSGTTGESALRNGRSATLVDQNKEAIAVMRRRLVEFGALSKHT
ncbi:MAG: site-specific DNA-methyltransferase (adenine-specific) [Planctomycetota bacterium]|jgi:site-specific DNA-methyltransferase (adenine-specific)